MHEWEPIRHGKTVNWVKMDTHERGSCINDVYIGGGGGFDQSAHPFNGARLPWGTVTSIYRLHISNLHRRCRSLIKRHFRRSKCIFKMSIPYCPHKLFRFVRFEEKLPKICDFGLCQKSDKTAVGTLLVVRTLWI